MVVCLSPLGDPSERETTTGEEVVVVEVFPSGEAPKQTRVLSLLAGGGRCASEIRIAILDFSSSVGLSVFLQRVTAVGSVTPTTRERRNITCTCMQIPSRCNWNWKGFFVLFFYNSKCSRCKNKAALLTR